MCQDGRWQRIHTSGQNKIVSLAHMQMANTYIRTFVNDAAMHVIQISTRKKDLLSHGSVFLVPRWNFSCSQGIESRWLSPMQIMIIYRNRSKQNTRPSIWQLASRQIASRLSFLRSRVRRTRLRKKRNRDSVSIQRARHAGYEDWYEALRPVSICNFIRLSVVQGKTAPDSNLS